MLKKNDKDKKVILTLINDKFGNYVMQRIFEYSESDLKREIAKYVHDHSKELTLEGLFVWKFI
jgi:hypothetical protein